MKKLIILLILLPCLAFAGEVVTTPQEIVISGPTSNKVEKLRMTFYYDAAGNHFAVVHYNILSTDGTRVLKKESVRVANEVDDPGTPEDESTTDFTDFVQGFAATMKSRGDTTIWQDIQSKYTVQ